MDHAILWAASFCYTNWPQIFSSWLAKGDLSPADITTCHLRIVNTRRQSWVLDLEPAEFKQKSISQMNNEYDQSMSTIHRQSSPGFSRHSARFRGNIPRFISHKAKQVHFKGNIPCPLSHQAKQANFNKLQPFPCHWCIYTVSLKRKLPPSRKTQIAWHTMQFLSLATRFLWCRTRFL